MFLTSSIWLIIEGFCYTEILIQSNFGLGMYIRNAILEFWQDGWTLSWKQYFFFFQVSSFVYAPLSNTWTSNVAGNFCLEVLKSVFSFSIKFDENFYCKK